MLKITRLPTFRRMTDAYSKTEDTPTYRLREKNDVPWMPALFFQGTHVLSTKDVTDEVITAFEDQKQVLYEFSEDGPPTFRERGGKSQHELEEVVTADRVTTLMLKVTNHD